MKVLVIEDEYSLADAIKVSLEKEALDVFIASDGETGGNRGYGKVR